MGRPQNPKGKLGVLLDNDKTDTAALNETAIIDVLMRPDVEDGGTWLELAKNERFVSALTVQHPLGLEVTVVPSESPSGSMAAFWG